MGLPVNKLICASNSNNVLTDFLRTGIYDRNRPFHTTISPSMDILISSNLERLLFDLSGENDAEIRMYMDALGSAGRYQVSDNIKAKLDDAFWGGCCSEEETEKTIRRYWQDHNYLIDPHTAVAAEVLAQYRAASGDETPAVVVSTASPYKFCGSVLTAIGETPCGDGLELLDQLHAASGVTVPRRLAELKGKSRRFDKTVEKQGASGAGLPEISHLKNNIGKEVPPNGALRHRRSAFIPKQQQVHGGVRPRVGELYRADPGVPEPTDGGGCAGAGGRHLLGNEP